MLNVLAVLFIGLASFGGGFFQTDTETGLFVSTPYPNQVVRAGESVSVAINVEVLNLPAQIVDVEARNVPDGWRVSFQGGGRVVNSVYVKPTEASTLTLKVEVPDDAADGTYSLTVAAKGDSRSAQLPLELVIGQSVPPQLKLEPDLPIITGTPTTSFSYRVKVTNEGDEDMLVNLAAELPEGFEVTFKQAFGTNELSTVPIKAGQTETVDMQVKLPDQTAAGQYKFVMQAQAADVSDQVELTAIVTGQPSLTLSSPDGRLSGRANAGRETPLDLTLKNDGSAPAENVSLDATAPSNWTVRMDPETVASLAPGEEVKVTAYLTPPDKAIAGDYVVTVRARPETGSSKSVEFRITVLTSTLWGVVGLVLIAAALAVVAVAVGRFGRR